MITSFPPRPLRNRGGYVSFEFIQTYNVLSFPEHVLHRIHNADIQIAIGATWLKGYATAETLSFNDDPDSSGNGPYYRPKVNGFTPGDSPALTDLMSAMSDQQQFIVRLKDPRGKIKIVGTKEYPLEFKASFSSGDQRSSSRGFSFQFFGNSLLRALECVF